MECVGQSVAVIISFAVFQVQLIIQAAHNLICYYNIFGIALS